MLPQKQYKSTYGPMMAVNLETRLREALRKYVRKTINEMSTTGGVAGYNIPAWGSKSKRGSEKGIQGSEKLGMKVVKNISEKGKV